jgi:MazG family protein
MAEKFDALCSTMTRLRAECPWDRAQTLKTLRSYLLEETHEVLEILDAPDVDAAKHKDELGDLMLQIVFQSEIQREAGRFDVGDVCDAIRAKLIRRHPHIFAAAVPEGVPGSKEGWEAIKRKERGEKKSALDGVPHALPALLRAYRTGEKARGAGFDWPTHEGVVDKIHEEVGELEEAIAEGNKEHIEHEIGDLLYALTNLSRHFEIDAEGALRNTIARFEQRFRLVEEQLAAEGKIPEKTPLEELEEKWQKAKKIIAERGGA